MAEHSWQYTNSKIPLDQLVVNIQSWAQSGGYEGKIKKKKDESVFTIHRGPGAWKGKVVLSVSGNQQMFNVRLDTGKEAFDSMARAIPDVVLHYTGAAEHVPMAQPQVQPQLQPQVQPQMQQPQRAAAPRGRVCPTCNNEANFVQQYNRWYCYTCQNYLPEQPLRPQQPMQPVQPQPRPQPQPVQPQPIAPPSMEPQKPMCPICSNEAAFIDQYQRWYCYNCQKYL